MDIKNYTCNKIRITSIASLCLVLIVVLLSGCNDTVNLEAEGTGAICKAFCADDGYDRNVYYNRSHNDKDIRNQPFHGVWMLEEIVLERERTYLLRTEADIELYGPEPQRVNIADFLGYELEITESFVRIGSRKLFYKEYIAFFSSLSTEDPFSFLFNPNIIWMPSYYNSPIELLNSLRNKGENLGISRQDSDDIYSLWIEFVYLRYNSDPDFFWFSGRFTELLDPAQPDYILNPLFSTILMLSYDYMLVGPGGEELVLARRIC